MAASTSDKITDVRNAARPNSTTVSSGRSGGGSTLACSNLAGWPTASKVHFVTYKIDSSSKVIAGSQLDCSGIVSGNSISSLTVIDGTDTGNAIGDVVEMLPTAAWGQDLADALTSQHTRTGTHGAVTTTSINNAGILTQTGQATFTAGTTLPAGDIGTADLAAASVTADKLATGAGVTTVITSQTTTSTSYADLATTGPSVTATIGANGLALVSMNCELFTSGVNNAYASVVISGANTQAITDDQAIENGTGADMAAGQTFLLTGLSAGSTTFKMQYRVSAGTGTFARRRISVVPL